MFLSRRQPFCLLNCPKKIIPPWPFADSDRRATARRNQGAKSIFILTGKLKQQSSSSRGSLLMLDEVGRGISSLLVHEDSIQDH